MCVGGRGHVIFLVVSMGGGQCIYIFFGGVFRKKLDI